MSSILAIAPKSPWRHPPGRDELIARVKQLSQDALPNNMLQGIRLELSSDGLVEPFVGPAALRALLMNKAKEGPCSVIIEAIAVAVFERESIPLVVVRRENDDRELVHRVAVVEGVVRLARKADQPMLIDLAMKRFECRAECRLREPARIGNDVATDYFRQYIVSALSRRDVELVVRDDVAADDAVLTALHEVKELTTDGDPDQLRGPVEKEGRVFFGA
jgi:hypothetical protein